MSVSENSVSIFEIPTSLPQNLFKISTSPFSCPWDSGRLGWIYVDLEEAAKDLYNDKKPKDLTPGEREKLIEYVNKAIDGELDVYNDYINGDVFGFSIQFRQEINEYVSIVRDDLEDTACGLYGSESLKEYLLDTFEHLLSIALKEEKTSEVIQKAVELLADKL